MHKKNLYLITLTVIILLVSLYFFKIERYFAEQNFINYITEQQIPNNNIQSQKIYRNYKQGGYNIDVIYKDDPKCRYQYEYRLKNKEPHHITLIIYTSNNVSVSLEGVSPKYPPLDNDK